MNQQVQDNNMLRSLHSLPTDDGVIVEFAATFANMDRKRDRSLLSHIQCLITSVQGHQSMSSRFKGHVYDSVRKIDGYWNRGTF